MNEIPSTLASYTGGSVSYNKNKMWRCPEAYIRSRGFGANPAAYYALYYNSVSSLYSSIDVSQSYDADGYEPKIPDEAMRRLGDRRFFRSSRWNSEPIYGWRSTIIASDMSHSVWGTVAGHMWGGQYNSVPYSVLQYTSDNSRCTANYAFDDGSVRAWSFTAATVSTVSGDSSTPPTMARAAGGPFDWDNYVLPRAALTPYQP